MGVLVGSGWLVGVLVGGSWVGTADLMVAVGPVIPVISFGLHAAKSVSPASLRKSRLEKCDG